MSEPMPAIDFDELFPGATVIVVPNDGMRPFIGFVRALDNDYCYVNLTDEGKLICKRAMRACFNMGMVGLQHLEDIPDGSAIPPYGIT